LEVTQQAGVHHVRNTRDPDLLLLWNNHEKPGLDFRFSRLDQSSWQYEQRFKAEGGAIPRFKAITPRLPWHLAVDYFGQTVVELTNREGVL
jgi:hypothetical protein